MNARDLPRPASLVPTLATVDPVRVAVEAAAMAFVEFLELAGHGEAAHALAVRAKDPEYLDTIHRGALRIAADGGFDAYRARIVRQLNGED